MRAEIAEVVSFLKSLVKLKNNVKAEKIDLFGKRLAVVLQEKFEGHWYPENPSKGQAYRCIRVNNLHQQDPELLRACRESGIKYSDLGLPWEITLWVDPGEVYTEKIISTSQLPHCPKTRVKWCLNTTQILLMRRANVPPPSPSPTGSALTR
uniref:Protein BTG3-like n=1 Tax=Gouania willdenowi TaxID=441366 RepID=A0A8C5GNX7_GOUWI